MTVVPRARLLRARVSCHLRPWSASVKLLRWISSVFRTSGHPMRVFDLRVTTVTTKQALEVPVAVNQDEDELTLEERFKNPLFWQSADFTYEEEKAGMNKEMQSMLNFDVFEEVKMAELTPAQLETVISTRWVKTRKSDGTCGCTPWDPERGPRGGNTKWSVSSREPLASHGFALGDSSKSF